MQKHLSDVFSRLDRARTKLRSTIDAIPATLQRQRPAPDRWSACEVLEHLTIVERYFSGRIMKAVDAARTSGPSGAGAARTPLPTEIEQRMNDRVNKRMAPETAHPTGALDVMSGWTALESGHTRLRDALTQAQDLDLDAVTVEHPVFGALTVYQLIELMAGHEGRHTEQIKEAATSLTAVQGHT